MANDLDTATVSVIYDKLVKGGVSRTDAAVIAGKWVIAQAGKDKRVFAFTTPLTAVEATCVAQFNRSFVHADWKDGESVVQAEETTVEEGFNKRFHAIEKDLDALGTDVKKAFQCLADLRGALRTLLEEARTEINRINADIYECCNDDRQVVFPGPRDLNIPVWAGGRFLGMVDIYGQPMQLWGTSAGTFVLPTPPGGGGGGDPWDDPRVKRPSELSRFFAENPNIGRFFVDNGPIAKEDLIKKFGDELSPGGVKVKELVGILPEGTRFGAPADMLAAVIEREAAAIRTSGRSAAARTAVFGLGADISKMADAPLDQFVAIPAAPRTALIAAGFTTLGKLSAADPDAVARMLKARGVPASNGDVAGWQASAKTMTMTG